MAATAGNMRVLDAIIVLQERTGFMPTVRELGAHLGMSSPSTVHRHLVALERAGYIESHSRRRRVTLLGRSAWQLRQRPFVLA